MLQEELIAALRLQGMSKVGDITAKKLIAHCGSPAAIFAEKETLLRKIDGIGTLVLHALRSNQFLEKALLEYQELQKTDWEISYFKEESYPELLKHCVDGPILLFKKGDIRLNNRRIISIVGTRNSSSYGRDFCRELISSLAPLNPVIVSGLAYGIDITAHKFAIEQGLQTIACMAHGLNQTYPKPHKKYEKSIMANGGFMTDFWTDSQPERENFLKRNRIIAGISEATIVIESAAKGGSLVTADIANSYNREVFAVPGRATDKFSLGCNNLIKQQKARLLTSAADLVYNLGWEIKSQAPKQQQLFVSLEADEELIYQYLQKNGKQLLDVLALECAMAVPKLSSLLFTMEMKGFIRPLPGKMFEAI